MSKRGSMPIFCERCPFWALAKLDAIPLCEVCLFAEMDSDAESSDLSRIAPLDITVAVTRVELRKRRKPTRPGPRAAVVIGERKKI